MAVGDYDLTNWNWTLGANTTITTGTTGTFAVTGNYTNAAFGIGFAKPKRRAFSVQWRRKDKRMTDDAKSHRHRGNGWIEFKTEDTPTIAADTIKANARMFPAVEWRIEPSE